MTGGESMPDEVMEPMDVVVAATSCLACHRPILAVTVRGWANAFDAVPTEGGQGGYHSPHRCVGRPGRAAPGFN